MADVPAPRGGPRTALVRAGLAEDLVITGEAVALQVRPASVGVRVLGSMLDALAYAGTAIVLVILGTRFLEGLNPAQLGVVQVGVFAVVQVLAPTAVETLTRGRSLGKLATGTRVVRDDGGPVRLRHGLVRALVGIGELWLTAGAIAVVSASLDRRGKRLGDVLAGTYVARVRDGGRAAPPLVMPQELAGWAATADIRRLPDGLGTAARTFLGRTATMAPGPRADLAASLAAQVEPFVSPPPPWGTPPERFLTAVLVARRDREYAAALAARERESAEAARLTRLPFSR